MFTKICALTAVVVVVVYLAVKQLRRRANRKRLLATPLPEQCLESENFLLLFLLHLSKGNAPLHLLVTFQQWGQKRG